ncbi:glycoside hydrolase family 3 N-terminal domain-containing protein [Thermodesulfobacteriota bacterium]
MNRGIRLFGGGFFLASLLLLFAGCGGDSVDRSNDCDDSPPPFCTVDEEQIADLLDQMTLEEKAAQMLVLGELAFPFWIPETTRRTIEELGIGGIFLQPFNALFPDPKTMSRLLNDLNAIAMSRNPAIPLFFSLDQEGGTTQAWQKIMGGTDGPGNMALGALDDPGATCEMYAMMGREIRAFGANMAYAPEFDLVASPEAAWVYTKGFGETGELTSRHAAAAVLGFQRELIMGAMKHFPGGGCVFEDTHSESPTCEMGIEELHTSHIMPFVTAIEAGADMVMVSPVIFTALDDAFPASLSAKVKIEFLRGELGFEGLISTGAMDMPPLQHAWGMPKEVLAIKSGADLLLYVGEVETFGDARRVIENIANAVRDGTIPSGQFNDSVARILRHKQKYCLFDRPFTDPEQADAISGSREHLQLAEPVIAGAITIVRNDAGLWPLAETGGRGLLTVSPMQIVLEDPATGFGMITGTTLGEQIKGIAPHAQSQVFMPGTFEFLMERAVARAAEPGIELIIIGTYNAHYDEGQADMVNRIIALGKPTVVVSFGTPFDLLSFPGASTYLAVYNFRDLAIQLAAETLFGRHEPLGRLPVTLPGSP